MFSRSFRRCSRVNSTDRSSAGPSRRTMRLEMLEDRRLLSVTPYVVNSLADNTDLDGVVTLREAIEAANTNAIVGDAHAGSSSETDVITFDSSVHGGTITLGGEELSITDELEIQGPGAELLTIDANKESAVIRANSAGELAVSGVTIQNGKGGIQAGWTTLTVSDAVITQCEATKGGGISSNQPLTVTNSTILNNIGTSSGGGIYCSSTLTVTGSTISDNWTWAGGGIFCEGLQGATVTDCVISGNHARYGGAGVYNLRELTVTDCIFTDNLEDGWATYGGAIYSSGTLTVANSTFANNNASEGGGAIYNDEGGEFVATDCAFSCNASLAGGGISNLGTGSVLSCVFEGNSTEDFYSSARSGGAVENEGDLELVNCTLVGNRASKDGGAIYNATSATVSLTNCTLAENEALHGGGIFNSDTLHLRNSILSGNAGGDVHGLYWSQSEVFDITGSLIGVDPAFVRNPDAGNDGVWGTDDDDYGDLCLTDQSMAVDLGNTADLPADTSDADADGDVGEPIPFDLGGAPRVHGVSVDAGAYEFQGDAAAGRETPSVVVTSDVDAFDPYDGAITLREAIYYSGSDGLGTVVTFDSSLNNATISLDGTALFVDKTLTIDASANGSLTLDAQGQSCVLDVFGQAGYQVTLIGLTITGGSGYYGGGIRNEGSDLDIVDCTIIRNTGHRGGGVYHEGGTLSVTNSRFYANAGVSFENGDWSSGGGIVLSYAQHSSIVNSVFCGNSAYISGGVENHSSSSLTLVSCSFVDNETGYGGVFSGGEVTLLNSIVSRNAGDNVYAEYAGANNLIGFDPQFVRDPSPGADAVWGTDDDDYGDLRLTDRSPAIDFGDSSLLPPDTFDLDSDGNVDEPVPVDLPGEPREYGASVDCGAYEFQAEAAAGREEPSLLVTTPDDTVDLFDGDISLREALFYVATSDIGTTISFDLALNNETILLDGEALMVDCAVTVDASSLDSLTVDGGGSNGVFYVMANPEDCVELIGLGITGGLAKETSRGISNQKSIMTIRDCRLFNNAGGAVGNGGTMEIVDCELLYNGAATTEAGFQTRGGAIRNGGTLTITNSLLGGNVAFGGGAIESSGPLTLINCILVGNRTIEFGGGGALGASYSEYTAINTIITANSAFSASGIDNAGTTHGTLYNCIVAGNVSTNQGQDEFGGTGSVSGSNNLIGVEDSHCELTDGTDDNLVGTAQSPLDPRFVRNPSDGGDGWGDDPSTPDVDESANDDFGDLRLRPDSPAIDAGDNEWLPEDNWDLDGDGNTEEPLPVDLAGKARIVGGAVDMGAYEYLAMPGDLNGDEAVDSGDLDIVRANWGSSVEAGSRFDGDPSGDGIVGGDDLDLVRANWGPAAPAAAAVDAVLAESALPSFGEPAAVPYGPLHRSAFALRDQSAARRSVSATALQAWLAEVEALDRGRDR